MVLSTTSTVDRHSEAYFAARIKTLQDEIREKNPSPDDDSSVLQDFLDACNALKSSSDSEKKAKDLLNDLQKDKNADPRDVQKAKDLLHACEQTLETTWKCGMNAGKIATNGLDLMSLEAAIIECTILVQSTAKGLAEFCAQGEANGHLIDSFLANRDWMKLMVYHGGASNGNYGEAVLIHSNLLVQIKDSSTEIRRKLAIAVALEFATEIHAFHDNEVFIGPIGRFWHYVKAYENEELDKAFETFSVWELRHAIDCDALDDQLQWGRDYLKAYRPDEVMWKDDHWKYVEAVRTDVSGISLELLRLQCFFLHFTHLSCT